VIPHVNRYKYASFQSTSDAARPLHKWSLSLLQLFWHLTVTFLDAAAFLILYNYSEYSTVYMVKLAEEFQN